MDLRKIRFRLKAENFAIKTNIFISLIALAALRLGPFYRSSIFVLPRKIDWILEFEFEFTFVRGSRYEN